MCVTWRTGGIWSTWSCHSRNGLQGGKRTMEKEQCCYPDGTGGVCGKQQQSPDQRYIYTNQTGQTAMDMNGIEQGGWCWVTRTQSADIQGLMDIKIKQNTQVTGFVTCEKQQQHVAPVSTHTCFYSARTLMPLPDVHSSSITLCGCGPVLTLGVGGSLGLFVSSPPNIKYRLQWFSVRWSVKAQWEHVIIVQWIRSRAHVYMPDGRYNFHVCVFLFRPRLMGSGRWSGTLQSVWPTLNSHPKVMCGALVSSCGRPTPMARNRTR